MKVILGLTLFRYALSSSAAFVVRTPSHHVPSRLSRNWNASPLVTLATSNPKEEEEESHVLTYSVTGTGCGSKVTMQNKSGMEMATDVPQKFGGTETAPTPVETLLAALIGCEQATSQYVGRSMNPRLLIDKIEFDLKMDRDARGALELPIEQTPSISACPKRCYGTATVFLRGEGKTISLDQLALLKEQTEARCPVANMLKASGCPMDIVWVDGNDSDARV